MFCLLRKILIICLCCNRSGWTAFLASATNLIGESLGIKRNKYFTLYSYTYVYGAFFYHSRVWSSVPIALRFHFIYNLIVGFKCLQIAYYRSYTYSSGPRYSWSKAIISSRFPLPVTCVQIGERQKLIFRIPKGSNFFPSVNNLYHRSVKLLRRALHVMFVMIQLMQLDYLSR